MMILKFVKKYLHVTESVLFEGKLFFIIIVTHMIRFLIFYFFFFSFFLKLSIMKYVNYIDCILKSRYIEIESNN